MKLAHDVSADHVSIDNGDLGCTGNHLEVWRWHREHPADFAVTLEDDAVPVPNFREQLCAALAVTPAEIVSLYLGSGYISDHRTKSLIRTAQLAQTCWMMTSGMVYHAVALAIESTLVESLTTHLRQTSQPIDGAIGRWARGRGHAVAYTVPSLVDHADEKSLVTPYRRTPRHAWLVGPRDRWTDSSMTIR